MKPIKVATLFAQPKPIVQILQSLPKVTPIEMKLPLVDSNISYLEVIFVEEEQVNWQLLKAHSDYIPFVLLAQNKTIAFKALKHSVVDMVISPFGKKEIEEAIQKCRQRLIYCNQSANRKKRLSDYPCVKGNYFHFVNIKKEIKSLDIQEIVYCKAEGNMTYLFLQNGQSVIGDFPISHCERLLEHFGLIRCHRKYIIDSNGIEKITSNNNSKKLKMYHSDHLIPIARRRWKYITQYIKI